MVLFNAEQFTELAQKQANMCVSIYIPTSRQSHDGYQADKINFKNALSQAKTELLTHHGYSADAVSIFLSEGLLLLEDQEFWKYSSDMLAYFIFDGEGVAVKLPLHVESPICQVSDRAYLLPLIEELSDDGHFYLLLLNLKEVVLFELTRSSIQVVELPNDIATSFTEELEDADNQKSLQHRAGIGEAGAMFHGQGSGSDESRKADILQFYHRLSTDIDAVLNTNPLPLMLAGVEYLIPIYKQAAKYTNIVEPFLTGSYSTDDMLVLSESCWELMEPYFRQRRLAHKEEYGLFAARSQASSDVETVVLASHSGSVDTLFLTVKKDVWGT